MENKVENKENALADEVMENVDGGFDGPAYTVKWTCKKCNKEFTFWGTDADIKLAKTLHSMECKG